MKEFLPLINVMHNYLKGFDNMLQKQFPYELESFHANFAKFHGKNANMKFLNEKEYENKSRWTFK